MPYKDRDQRLAYLRTYREKHPDVRVRTDYQARKRQGLREYVAELKKAPCMDCSGTFPTCAMDFDHRPGETKVHAIHQMITRNASMVRLKAEIAKCDLVCANCHRIRGMNRGWHYGADGRLYSPDETEVAE